jgi:hypothetical protein
MSSELHAVEETSTSSLGDIMAIGQLPGRMVMMTSRLFVLFVYYFLGGSELLLITTSLSLIK